MSAFSFFGFNIASAELTHSWGVAPGSGRISVPGDATSSATPYDEVTVDIGGFTFMGIVSANPKMLEDGTRTEFEVLDQRAFLMLEDIWCGFNFSEVREDDPATPGIDRQKRWWHIFPDDWDAQVRTYTAAPLSAKDILDKIAAFSERAWTFSTHPDQEKPVYNIDALNGTKFGTILSEISDQHGLVFTLSDDLTLTWCRKGFTGDSPDSAPVLFPPQSWNRKVGESMSNLDTVIRVVGERNRYQDMPIILQPSWNRNWEKFWSEPEWLQEVDNVFGPFADEEQAALVAKARSVTVREYDDQVPDDFQDFKVWGEVGRMEIPAWIYMQDIVYKAYEVPPDYTVNGIDIESIQIFDGLMAAVTFSIDDGSFALKSPREYYPDCKAFVVAQGQPLELLDPRTQGVITAEQLASAQKKWSAQNKWNLDVRNRVLHFEHAVFLAGEGDKALFLFPNQDTGIDSGDPLYNIAVPNPNAEVKPASVKAVMCWEAERYQKTYGSGQRGGSKNIGSLNYHALMIEGVFSEEVPYADGDFADQKANKLGALLVKATDTYRVGGYHVASSPPELSASIDRISVSINGLEGMEFTVEFAKERGAQSYEGDRSLDRKTRQHDLFPHQKKNKEDVERLNEIANISRELKRQTVPHYQTMADLLHFPVGAMQSSPNLTKLSGKAGQPIFMADDGTVDNENGKGFQGVLIHEVKGDKLVCLATQGIVPVRIKSPFKTGDAIGMDEGDTDASANGSRLIGVAQFPCSLKDGTVVLCPVQLGAAAKNPFFNFEIYDNGDDTVAIIYGTLNDQDPTVTDDVGSDVEPQEALGSVAVNVGGELVLWLVGNISKADSGVWQVDSAEIDTSEPGNPATQCWTKIATVTSSGEGKSLVIDQNLRASQWFVRCKDDGSDDRFGGR